MGTEEGFDNEGREPLVFREVVKRQTERVNEGWESKWVVPHKEVDQVVDDYEADGGKTKKR